MVPAASFEVASFVDAELPDGCDAVLGIGEVLGYAHDERVHETLDEVFSRCAGALRPGGLLLFDLARPGRADASPTRTWTEGAGWAVLVETQADERLLTRRIVTFRDPGDGGFRRSEEAHRLILHRPAAVLTRLRRHGFAARTLAGGL